MKTRFLRDIWRAILDVCRHPPSRKTGWVMVAVWATALLFPVTSVALNPERGLDLTIWQGWSNVLCGSLDAYMLYRSFLGLLWTYDIPRQGK